MIDLQLVGWKVKHIYRSAIKNSEYVWFKTRLLLMAKETLYVTQSIINNIGASSKSFNQAQSKRMNFFIISQLFEVFLICLNLVNLDCRNSYHNLAVIRSALMYLWSKKNGCVLQTWCKSHRVTLDCIMRDGLKKGVCYEQDVNVSLQEYGIQFLDSSKLKAWW